MVKTNYYIPINDMFQLSVFWLSDTESCINELRFSDPLKRGYCRLPVFAARLRLVNFKQGTRGGKHDDVMSRNLT